MTLKKTLNPPWKHMTYLGKHNVSDMDLPTKSRVHHFGLSPSGTLNKDPVSKVFDDVFISYIEILQSILPDITKVKLVSMQEKM